LYACIFYNVPATLTNLLTGGGVAGVIGILVAASAPLLRSLSEHIRWGIVLTVTQPDPRGRAIAGFIWGVLSCYGSKVGWYHSIHLPLILLEMETGDPSFLGAVDELSLVLVCAGVCLGSLLGKWMRSSLSCDDTDCKLWTRGLATSICCGDFIEVCYPLMNESALVNFGGYLGSGLSCMWLVLGSTEAYAVPKSSAYLPWLAAVGISYPHWYRFVGASVLAIIFPLIAALAHQLGVHGKRQ
jgi:hypothetical protein